MVSSVNSSSSSSSSSQALKKMHEVSSPTGEPPAKRQKTSSSSSKEPLPKGWKAIWIAPNGRRVITAALTEVGDKYLVSVLIEVVVDYLQKHDIFGPKGWKIYGKDVPNTPFPNTIDADLQVPYPLKLAKNWIEAAPTVLMPAGLTLDEMAKLAFATPHPITRRRIPYAFDSDSWGSGLAPHVNIPVTQAYWFTPTVGILPASYGTILNFLEKDELVASSDPQRKNHVPTLLEAGVTVNVVYIMNQRGRWIYTDYRGDYGKWRQWDVYTLCQEEAYNKRLAVKGSASGGLYVNSLNKAGVGVVRK